MTIDGYELLEIRPDFASDITVDVVTTSIGNRMGEARAFLQYPTQRPVHSLSRDYVLPAVTAEAFADFFDDHAGQWKAFLVPSYCSELGNGETNSTASTSGTPDLYIDWCDYEAKFEPVDGNLGRYIFILWDDGTFFATKVLSVSDTSAGIYDKLQLNDNLPKGVSVTSPPIIGFVYLVNFATDELEMEFFGDSNVVLSAPMIESLISTPEADV